MNDRLVRVGITTHNRCDTLERAITSAQTQQYAPLEIVVIDDASTDGTMELARQFPRVSWLSRDRPYGYVKNRNELMQNTAADYYVSLDDDAWFIDKDEIQVAVAAMERNPAVAAVAFDILSPSRPAKAARGIATNVANFVGCGHMLRLSAVREAGWYENMPGAYGAEEKDLCLRLADKGYEIQKLNGVHVWHEQAWSSRQWNTIHRSGVCNDLSVAAKRSPFPEIIGLIPYKILSHLWFGIRCRQYLKPAAEGIALFFRHLPEALTVRVPVRRSTFWRMLRLQRAGQSGNSVLNRTSFSRWSRVRYLLQSLLKVLRASGRACPNCREMKSICIDRKYVVTTLHRCCHCKLLFRRPTISARESAIFYQRDYDQGFTTTTPSEAVLRGLLGTQFKNSPKDYTQYIAILHALGVLPGQRLTDFGSSWGYGAWQLANAGFEVQGFEISRSRCAFAREQLNLNATANINDLRDGQDCFFSAHVIEHVPSVAEMINVGRRLLRPGGLFVAFTPNGSLARRQKNSKAWHCNWGLVHPQLIDERFFVMAADGDPYLIASTPYDMLQISRWNPPQSLQLDVSGDELMIAFRTAL
jgi:GT2 family glycosyltransferase/2-polyprenyl-3-methyl-5-hydroxy-6-metoxy-1,4-benzoquinol methylase